MSDLPTAPERPQTQVRLATLADTDLLANFAILMANETESKDLNPALVNSGIHNCLLNPAYGKYCVASLDSDPDTAIGCLMITFEMSPMLGGLIYWIQSVYVVPEHRAKGVFRALYNYVVEETRKDPIAKCVRLYVDAENTSA